LRGQKLGTLKSEETDTCITDSGKGLSEKVKIAFYRRIVDRYEADLGIEGICNAQYETIFGPKMTLMIDFHWILLVVYAERVGHDVVDAAQQPFEVLDEGGVRQAGRHILLQSTPTSFSATGCTKK
jgi:hypothetical protein